MTNKGRESPAQTQIANTRAAHSSAYSRLPGSSQVNRKLSRVFYDELSLSALRSNSRPRIAVFDSGVGGLTVLRAIAALIPNADYLYFGDTARLPYGSKSRETVARYTIGAAQFLEQHGIDMLVIGCNTASALALFDIRGAVSVPVIGVIEPGADAAVSISKTREAIVLGTEATVSSHAYQRALARRGFATFEKACPLLVPLVEEGWINHPVTEQVARIYMEEAIRGAAEKADVLVLGCTHYPLIKSLLRRVTPKHISIVDSAESTAHATLAQLNGVSTTGQPTFRFFVTDSVEKFRRMAPLFLDREVDDVELVDLGG